ncbi:MAG: ammonia channel protein, partial [Caldimonas sp.]
MNKLLLAFLFSLLAMTTSGHAFAQAPSDPASSSAQMAAPPAPAAPAALPGVAAGSATTAAASTPAAAAPVPNKGDVAWMLVCTALVIMMSVPALALFYGGLVRSKNMLSVLMQVFVTFSLIV